MDFDLTCPAVAERTAEDCAREEKCALGFVKDAVVTKYLGQKSSLIDK